MKTRTGIPFHFIQDYEPIDGLTISSVLSDTRSSYVFSLGKDTDISKEANQEDSVTFIVSGKGYVNEKSCKAGDVLYVPENRIYGKESKNGRIYIEFLRKKEDTIMNEKIKTGEVFALKDLVPYQEGKVISLDVFKNEKGKRAVLSRAEGTRLEPHKAPGQALLFILDGTAVLSYEGKDYEVHAGGNFSFAKGGRHGVYAKTNRKFALVLEL